MTTSVQELRTIIDFGLVVLIWIIQLIVYPGFKYTDFQLFTQWHSQYANLISFIVIPLMLGQVAIIGIQLFNGPNWAVWISAILVALVWASTFFQAVPIHNALQASPQSVSELQEYVSRLVSANWIRTVIWSCIFGLGLVRP